MPVWYYRSIAPLFYLLAALTAFGVIFFLIRSFGNWEKLWLVAESAVTSIGSFFAAKWFNRHADNLERQQSVKSHDQDQDGPSESD